MAGTPTIATRVMDRLTLDSSLTALLTGGIYPRELKREGDGSTPNAFASTPPYQPRPAVVVRDDGDADDALGPGGAQFIYVTVWFYAQAHQNGRDAIANAIEITKGLLLGWRTTTSNGTGAIVENVAGRLGVRDDPVVANRIVDNVRFQISGLWRVIS